MPGTAQPYKVAVAAPGRKWHIMAAVAAVPSQRLVCCHLSTPTAETVGGDKPASAALPNA